MESQAETDILRTTARISAEWQRLELSAYATTLCQYLTGQELSLIMSYQMDQHLLYIIRSRLTRLIHLSQTVISHFQDGMLVIQEKS